jgi:DNA-binding response OmpR family regulator
MNKILLVEDSEESKHLVCHALGPSFEVIWTNNLNLALKSISENEFDLILLDVGLPDGDGFRFFSMLLNDGQYKKIPVFFLSANDGISDKVLGISLGADDYIVKPFQAAELKARVEMRIKKYYMHRSEGRVFRKGQIEINLNAQRAYRLLEEKKKDLELTPLEFKLLTLMLTHEETVFSRNQLFDQVWGTETYITDRCVDTHIYSLRKKLGDLAGYVQAVYGEGYRFSLERGSYVSKKFRNGGSP